MKMGMEINFRRNKKESKSKNRKKKSKQEEISRLRYKSSWNVSIAGIKKSNSRGLSPF